MHRLSNHYKSSVELLFLILLLLLAYIVIMFALCLILLILWGIHFWSLVKLKETVNFWTPPPPHPLLGSPLGSSIKYIKAILIEFSWERMRVKKLWKTTFSLYNENLIRGIGLHYTSLPVFYIIVEFWVRQKVCIKKRE